ncbi:MAG: RdgB/HAM1 family non-canonical purine NTP pyrophosphatase [Clostridia bacterium]
MEKRLILIAATKNPHKIGEFREIFSAVYGDGFEVLSEEEAVREFSQTTGAGYVPPEETGKTFAANAFLKAAGIYRFLELPLRCAADTEFLIVADDSGLCVDALNGAPGVLSARYASQDGKNAGDAENVKKLLREMETVPDGKRNASFVCAISAILLRSADRPIELLNAQGHLPGIISREPHGSHGFGYDPVLYLPEYGKCVAELDPECKNRISHRGKALRQLAYKYYGTN